MKGRADADGREREGAPGSAKSAGRPPGKAAAQGRRSRSSCSPDCRAPGKSQAIRALEDLGYFCVDNLPTTLIPTLAKLSLRAGGDMQKVAIVVDVREGGFLSSFPKIFKRLRKMPRLNPVLIFLEASNAALVRRFSETRRPHPLAPGRSVSEGIREERSRLNVIRKLADEIIDTSDMTVHELRHFFMGLSRDRGRSRLVITLLSFGFKHGVPVDADLVFDVRCLPNPHFVPTLRRRTGRDKAVADFLERDPSTRQFMDRLEDYLRFVIPFYIAEGKSYLTIAIGCTGGRHRSVMIAERLRKGLGDTVGVRARARPASRSGARPGGAAMIGVVVVTHGQLATELLNAAEMIVGDLPQFTAVSIGWHEDVNDAREDIAQAIERVRGEEGVFLLTDMFGGTPSNLGMTFLETDRLEVITGVNLPMLIKLASLRRSSDLLAVAKEMRDHGRSAIWVASDLLRGEKSGG